MKRSRGREFGVAGNGIRFAVEQLEARIVLTGYFAGGISYDSEGPVLFSEFGNYDGATGSILNGTRSDTANGTFGTPWSGFTLAAPSTNEQSGLSFTDGDDYASRVSVGIGTTPLGFSIGYGGSGYQLPIEVNYIFNQATDLGEGSGGRDGDFYFNGAVRDVTSGAWSFVHGPANIDGLALTGHQTLEGDVEVPYSYNLNPSAIFRDGYTLFDGHTSVALFGDDLTSVVQTDLDGADGFQSYSIGMKVDLGTSFSVPDLAGDVFALSLTGSSSLGGFFGETGGSSEAFTYTGALEFADGGTFRLYELRDFYASGRDDAGILLSGTYALDGDDVSLTSLDESRSLDLKLNADLSLSLGLRYEFASHVYHAFGGGPRISDGDEGDYPAVDTSGDGGGDEPVLYNFTQVYPTVDGSGDAFVIGKTDTDEEVRFNISTVSGLVLGNTAYAAWLEDDGAGFEFFGTTAAGVHYVRRGADGLWSTGSITGDTSQIPATMVDWDMLPGGGMTLGGFNAAAELLRFDCVGGVWSVDRITGIPAPDGAPGTPTGEVDLLVTPWNGWHLMYLDSAMSLRAAWTTPTLSTYYDNNLSARTGLSSVDTNALHSSYTGAGQISIGLINSGELSNLWWRPGFAGAWNNTNFADVVGSAASGLSPDFVGTYADHFTGELYNFGIKADESDAVVIRFSSTGWDASTVRTDLGLASYRVAPGSSILLGGLASGDGFELQGRVPGLGGLPIVSRLFTNRSDAERDQSLLLFLTPSLVEPTDGE